MLSLIWAQAVPSGVIGRDGDIPWRLPEDLAHFKELTVGHTVVMGRRTWESLPASVRPLPGRRNVVLTRAPDYRADGAEVLTSLADALDDDAWVMGGAEIYRLALPLATRCEVTEVDLDLPARAGDALAPRLDESWTCVAGDWRCSAAGLRHRFLSYRR
ncbi:dihydrofolate reductase [Mycolicibacterium brumae]|uniref:Dihydrofolate reductase n=1 Tax=Mycolicibacterium brumae TaxID=85968 RepID=A0A2G5P3Y8_9MYCO|nr:dihydrofolate reductase [Mycolicibacterium brumae]MCV7193440.1 dihydrofolate reductase [Mycolicibacterium brumae]PIB73139.1 dihydrofolate reductase [Mycolicibacterium brumae]RWA17141.1 hypothetical protein MBRU_05825 [Mycolicibacterium brumae DSM 44177]UWW09287.1 dihydrofolate reductase [Mycolicibacterium brumae]